MNRRAPWLLALVVILAMTSVLASLPAFAANYTFAGDSTKVSFSKYLVVNNGANVPNVTFEYRIQRAEPIAATATTVEILSAAENASIGSAVFASGNATTNGTPSDNAASAKSYASQTIPITFPANSFTKPGIYRYVITETATSYPGITHDANTTRYLDVVVVANDSDVLNINSFTLRNAATNIGTDGKYVTSPDEKSQGFTNTAEQYDLTFSKAITGNQADKNKQFSFTLSISNAIPNSTFAVNSNITGAANSITVSADGTYTGNINLTNGSNVKIIGLNKDAKATITEDAQDYSAAHVIDSGASTSGSTSGELTMTADHNVAFTNTRNGVVPTGVLLTIAPFAIGLLLFGALGIFLMARKRRTDDED